MAIRQLLIGLVCLAIGLAGLLLLRDMLNTSGLSVRAYPSGPAGMALLAVVAILTIAFVVRGTNSTVQAIKALLSPGTVPEEKLTPEKLAAEPWLKNQQWRTRTIVHSAQIRGSILMLAWMFIGLPALAFLGIAITDPVFRSGESVRWPALLSGAMLAIAVGGLTYWWLRHRRYGNSVCRLLTLPAVPGGWLKADVHCKLPPGPEPVTVRLKNMIPAGKHMNELWRMEQTLDIPVSSERQYVVPVRLHIPLDSRQRPIIVDNPPRSALAELFAARPVWILEIEKPAKGIDFLASFAVPVYALSEAPATEPRQA